METINQQIFLQINQLAGNWFIDALNCFIAVGAPYILAVILTTIYLFGNKDNALFAFYTAVLGLGINLLIAGFYFYPRPFMVGLGQPLMHHGIETSFPSDHATLAFCVAFSFLLSGDHKLGAALFLLALMTGFSRVYTGLHFPLDVAGSFVVALVAALIICGFRKRLAVINRSLNRLYENLFAAAFKRNQ